MMIVYQAIQLQINIDEFADLCNAIASQFEKEPAVSDILIDYFYFDSVDGIW